MKRELFSSGTPWEPIVGYSRAVRVGNEIWVSGTTATDGEGHIVGKDDAYRQTRQAIANIERVLAQAGARPSDVVRTRIYVTDIAQWEAIGRAHGEAFAAPRPAAAVVEGSRLIDGAMLGENEAHAVLRGSSG